MYVHACAHAEHDCSLGCACEWPMRQGHLVLLCSVFTPHPHPPEFHVPQGPLARFSVYFFLEASDCFLKKPDPELRQKLGLPEEKPHSLPLSHSPTSITFLALDAGYGFQDLAAIT